MTICLKFFGGYLGNVEKVLGFQYFLPLRTVEFKIRFKPFPNLLEVRYPSVASAVGGTTGLPNSFGSKNSFGRRRCLGDRESTQFFWK